MRTVRLRHLAEVNPATSEFDRMDPNAEVLFLPLEGVWADERLDLTRRRSKADVASGYVRFKSGDVLCPKVTPTFQAARSALIPVTEPAVGAASTEVHLIRALPGVSDPRFIRYSLMTKQFLEQGVAAFQGVAGLQRVPDEFVRDVRLPAFELAHQRRIADFLDDQTTRIDKIVAARERQMSLLRDEGLEHARQLTTIGLTGGTTMTGIEWMPIIGEGWALRRVASLFWTGSGTTPTSDRPEYFGGGIPWVVTGDIRDADVVSTENSVTELALRDFTPLRLYPPGSLVVAMYGATRGRVGILRIRACVNQACCVLRPLGEMTSELAAAWFRAHNEQIVELAMGSGQPNLNQEIIRALRVPVPSRAEQTVILAALAQEAERTKRAEALRDSSVALLQEFKRSLISAAVSGEFDVSTASGRGVPA